MNMITTIITYPKIKKVKLRGIKARRAAWAADGLCQQCGGERPCYNHTTHGGSSE